MKCPHCGKEISFVEICPHCGQRISYGGNTVLYRATARGKLTYREIFSNVWKRHTPEQTARSISSAPASGIDMLSAWEKPWLFARLFAVMLIMSLLLFLQADFYASSRGTYTAFATEFTVLMTLIGPMTVAFFVWEMDIHRQINLINFLGLLFFGGILTTALAMPVNTALQWPAWTAGLTEETIKLLISVGFIFLFRRSGLHCLDGLAIGAAVGAGFAFWENILYAYQNSASVGLWSMAIWRSFWGLLGSHMLYTAPYVGALCHGINGGKLKKEHFAKPFFLTMLVIGMGCHALNNAEGDFGVALILRFTDEIVIPLYWSQIVLAIISWAVLLYMLRRGINQAMEVNDLNQAIHLARREKQTVPALVGLAGTCAGSAFAVEERPILIGREPKECNLVLGGDAVSRRHGALRREEGQLFYQDLGSSNGSYINGKKLNPHMDYPLRAGDILEIGSGGERFEVK